MSPDPLATALVLLGIASLAAVQARAARGAPRHRVHEICRDRGTPGLADEIFDGSEPVAFIAATIVVVAATAATPGALENYPVRPVRLIVPQSPGGGSDLYARMVAQPLAERINLRLAYGRE